MTFVQVNVADRTSVDHAVKEIVQAVGHVDVLVNGTSVLADKDVDTTVAVNLVSVSRLEAKTILKFFNFRLVS